jgi:predicted nucleic-acid-binding Zn-ribbon protein
MSHQPSTTCTKCGGTTEFGIIADAGGLNPALPIPVPERVLEWIRGLPKKSFLDHSFRVPPEDRLQIASLRCTRCGYLEFYAPEAR